MEINEKQFNGGKEKARILYVSEKEIYSPYFKTKIILNSDGFHHLQFSSDRERNKKEQLLKFRLLPLALKIIRQAGTLQEYRKGMVAVGKRYARDGAVKMKEVEYWGFVAILDLQNENKIKVRTILRRVGDGNIIFWSVMFGSKMKNGNQKLFADGLEDE